MRLERQKWLNMYCFHNKNNRIEGYYRFCSSKFYKDKTENKGYYHWSNEVVDFFI